MNDLRPFYSVAFKVEPTVDHPSYLSWDSAFEQGEFSVCLYAKSIDEATSRARNILENLPFNILSDEPTVLVIPVAAQLDSAPIMDIAARLQRWGIVFCLTQVPLGETMP